MVMAIIFEKQDCCGVEEIEATRMRMIVMTADKDRSCL